MPSTNSQKTNRKKGTRAKRLSRFVLKHTWVIPILLIIAFLLLYAINPTESNIVHHFIFLSYRLPIVAGTEANAPSKYGKGLWDIAFVSFYTIVLTFTREFIMQELLLPLARYQGLRSRAKQERFLEQMYTAVYFSILGPAGIYVMSRSPVWFYNTRGMYEGFPHKILAAELKCYYLFQAAYWVQQALVLILGLERPRKDYKELVVHHIVTLSLIALSYRFHFTHIGVAVYLAHDLSDLFLAISKSLNYVDSPLQGYSFSVCIAVWIYTRHYQSLRIINSLFNEFQTVGPYEMDWETDQYKCPLSFAVTLTLLASLQGLNLFWLYCLFRSAYRLVVYKIAKDDRSEAEESALEEEVEHNKGGAINTANQTVDKKENVQLLNGNKLRSRK